MKSDLTTPVSDELLWEATRYVGDDMTDAERLRFEERLATDVQACEAVALAVRLGAGLQSALAAVSRPELRFDRTARRRRWVPVALCAALLLATGILVTYRPVPSPERVEVATAELLNRWRLDRRFGLIEELDAEIDVDGESDIVDESLSAPGWLVSAVRLTEKAVPERTEP